LIIASLLVHHFVFKNKVVEEAGRFERMEGGAPLGRFDAMPASFPNTLANQFLNLFPSG
jgi:hypothetical protein